MLSETIFLNATFFFFYFSGNGGKQIKGGYLLRYKSKMIDSE